MRSSEPTKRSSFATSQSRVPQPWPEKRDFRILSLDGGGIKGVFTAAFLAELERRADRPTADLFDLIVGTSTGGILAIGLAADHRAEKLVDLYAKRGREIFPPLPWPFSMLRLAKGFLFARYDATCLRNVLIETLGENLRLADIQSTRLCIQAFDAFHGEVFVYKTPHHPDYHLDGPMRLLDVAMATSAAPSYFMPQVNQEGYVMADGGVWANNPIMVGIVEAYSAFDVPFGRIKVLSIGCGDTHRPIGFMGRHMGGMLPWAGVIFTAMRLQSHSALGQAKQLLGSGNLLRVDVEEASAAAIAMDDWQRAQKELLPLGETTVEKNWHRISELLNLEI